MENLKSRKYTYEKLFFLVTKHSFLEFYNYVKMNHINS